MNFEDVRTVTVNGRRGKHSNPLAAAYKLDGGLLSQWIDACIRIISATMCDLFGLLLLKKERESLYNLTFKRKKKKHSPYQFTNLNHKGNFWNANLSPKLLLKSVF